jgi:hypothetical protein
VKKTKTGGAEAHIHSGRVSRTPVVVEVTRFLTIIATGDVSLAGL